MNPLQDIPINSFSLVEQDIYRFIFSHLEEIPYMRVRDISQGAEVSSTSVFRFIKKLGYNSFPEFKFHMKQSLQERKGKKQGVISIEESLKQLSLERFHPDIEYQIKRLAQDVGESDFILFVGMGASGAIGEYIARKIANLGYGCINLPEITYPIYSLLQKGRKNLLVFLSISGETPEVIEVLLGVDSSRCFKKYCVTQNKDSSLARLCDYSLEYNVKEERKNFFFDLTTQIPAVLILECLVSHLQEGIK